jgi:hypothetical protein
MSDAASNAINLRIFRTMVVTTGLAVLVSAVIGPWRVTTGLLVGGLLALLSHRWLKNSAAAAIELSIGGATPRLRLAQFMLRYLVIGALVFSLSQLDVLSLPFTLWGMSTFVVAIFVEAVREFYFAIIQREEIS